MNLRYLPQLFKLGYKWSSQISTVIHKQAADEAMLLPNEAHLHLDQQMNFSC
jgi:hypothetical protein